VNRLAAYARSWAADGLAGWNRFWFMPADPATLALIRILAGAMLFYTHLVWSLDLEAFFGPNGWLSPEAVGWFQRDGYAWSYFWFIQSPAMLWTVHLLALLVFALLTLGLFTRLMSILAFVATLSYIGRVPGALFGLDQMNGMLAMYLMIGPAGARYSLDRLLAQRQGKVARPVEPSVAANVAVRLIQLHMCVIYLFAGASKLTGQSWWDGNAMWLAFGNLEYQSLDMTWLADWPRLVNVMTHLTIVWEVYYCALIWPRQLRPIMLVLAVPVHIGIAACLGMMTFGLVMLIGNLAFVSPAIVRAMVERKKLEHSQAEPPVSASAAGPGKKRRH